MHASPTHDSLRKPALPRRAVMSGLLCLTALPLLAACGASCSSKTDEDAQACAARIAERRKRRIESRPPGGR